MDMCLDDAVVMVTGGSSGVGLATVQLLLEEGAAVATCGRSADRLASALDPLRADVGDRLFWQACDVRESGAVSALVQATVGRFGRLTGLVNNAGQSRVSTFATTSTDDWRDELELKLLSVVNTVSAAQPYLAAAEAAAIVNVNSVLARQPEPHLVATSAARAGVLSLSRSLAAELAPAGIRVNSVNLGLIDTGQWQRRYEAAETELTYERWSAAIAADRGIQLGRFGRADEVAALIVTLLSPRSSYVTGGSVDVGGGVHRYV